jgi:hypothetical protein
MANDVNIKGKISIDTGDSSQQISNVKKGLNDVSATAKDSHSNFSNLKDSLTKLSPGLKDSSEGVGTLNTAFKALLANPIVLAIAAIIAVLVGLYKAFTATVEGAQKMEQVFEGIKSVMSVLTDRLVTLGNAVVKLFSGDFKGAADAAKASVEGLSDAIGEAYTKTVEITKQLQKIRKEEREDVLDKSVREKRLALLREQLNDESVSIKERIKIAKELRDDQVKNAEEDKARTIKKSDLEIEKIKLKKNLTEEDLNEINKLEIEKNKVETENALEGVRTNKVIRNLQKQDNAERKAELAEQKKLYEELKKQAEEEAKAQLKRMQSLRDASIITVQSYREAIQKVEDEKEAKLKKLESERLAKQKDFLDKQKNLLSVDIADNTAASLARTELAQRELDAKMALKDIEIGALNVFADLVGRQTLVGKALAIASATISTYMAAAKSLAADYSAFGPAALFAKIAATATTIAVGLNTVRSIVAVQVPGGGSGGSVPSGGFSAGSPLSPQPIQTNTRINQSSINGIGSAAAGGVGRTFVLDADIKDSQERSARITRAARLG